MIAGPSVAAAATAKVSVLAAPVAGFALKLAVTPEGKPVAASITAPAKPAVRATLIVVAAVDPWMGVTLGGAVESVTPAPGFTVTLIDVVWLETPVAIPVTLTVAGPGVAVAAAVKVRVLLAPVAGFALKVAVTPIGKPVAASV